VSCGRSQQLRSDGDDLSVHVSSLNESKALHAPGEMENSVGSDQHRPAIPQNASPTRPCPAITRLARFSGVILTMPRLPPSEAAT